MGDKGGWVEESGGWEESRGWEMFWAKCSQLVT